VILWLDAQLPPALAAWLSTQFGVTAIAVRDVGLERATDRQILIAAHDAGAVVVTKDSDFVALIDRMQPSPQVLWLTVGNTSNAALRDLFTATWPRARQLLESGDRLVEISGR
jgi:predicted nuclease of predicted toxin-antitoxin system